MAGRCAPASTPPTSLGTWPAARRHSEAASSHRAARQAGPAAAHPPEQEQRDAHVQQVPPDAVEKCRVVAAGEVEHPARHPAPQRHAHQRGHDHRAHTRAGFLRREVLADDDGVAGHDAALEQAEHGRDEVQRHHAVEGQEHQQGHALQGRAQQQRANSADAVADPARHQAADDAAGQHEREHLGAARRAKAQVHAVGHDVHLRHGHGHAAGHAGHAQQGLRLRGLHAEGA